MHGYGAELSLRAQAGRGRPSGSALQAAGAARIDHRFRYWFFTIRREPAVYNSLSHASPNLNGPSERRPI